MNAPRKLKEHRRQLGFVLMFYAFYQIAPITSNTYYDWMIDRAYMLVPVQDYVAKFLGTFKEYPPRQKAASFSLDQVMEKLSTPVNN